MYKNFNQSVRTAFVVKSVAAAGRSTDKLNPFEFGIVDAETWQTVTGPFNKNKNVHFVVGSPNTGQPLDGLRTSRLLNVRSADISFKSEKVFGHNIEKILVQKPVKDIKPFIGYFGWNGLSLVSEPSEGADIPNCRTMEFKCGKTYRYEVQVRGRLVRSIFGKDIRKEFEVVTACCDDCVDQCDAPTKYENYLNELVAKMNADYQIGRFGLFESVIECSPALTRPTQTSFTKYCVTVCDNGDELDLAAVQSQYPTLSVTRKSRNAPYSTYEVVRLTSDGAPAAFTQTAVVLKGCVDCPSGYTATAASQTIILEVDGIASNPTSDVDSRTAVNTILGGSTATAAKWLSYENGSTRYLVSVPTTWTDPGTLADSRVVDYLGIKDAICTQTTPTSTSWAACGTAYKIKRELCMTLKNSDCNAVTPDLTAVTAAVAGYTDYVAGSIAARSEGDCITVYTAQQYSNLLEDGCDTYGENGARFVNFPTYQGQRWDVCPCEGWTVDGDTGCPIPPVPTERCCKYGIKVTGKIDLYRPTGQEFDLNDNYRIQPLHFNISQVATFKTEQTDYACQWEDPGFWVAQEPSLDQLSGQTVLRDVILYRMYREEPYFTQDRMQQLMNKAEGIKYGVNLNDYYYAVTIQHRLKDQGQGNGAYRPVEEIVLYINEKDLATFEAVKALVAQYTQTNGVHADWY